MSGFLKAKTKPSTVSHWIATNSGPDTLHNHGRDDKLPESADIVVVGAGIAGALLAYHLTHPEDVSETVPKGSRIVILEGSEVASSASHFAPATFASFPKLVRSRSEGGAGLTKAHAVDILKQEWDNYARNKDVIKKHDLVHKVDLWEGNVMTVYKTQEGLDTAFNAFQQWNEALEESGSQDYSNNVFCKDPKEALRVSRVQGAIGYSTRTAGTVHPHKLTTELLKLSISSTDYDVSLHTTTPALSITPKEDQHIVETSRGTIKAKRVVLCTNAHTPHLFPEEHPLKSFIFPIRIQMGVFTPPPEFSGTKSPQTSYGFPTGYCATSTSGIVVGISVGDYIGANIGKSEDYICNSDDTVLLPECTKYLEGFMTRTFDGWNENAIGEGLMRTWTGVIAATIDRLPLIGPVPDTPGLFISAGYNGHGMSTTHTCGRALAKLILHETWDQQFPEAYIISKERLARKLPEGGHYQLVTGVNKTT
ncbi:uncharacterized protein IL334_000861 [Kwoniella shivajii]|uniref:FAD dependent oxidoreductase domain-containing protein n=1 Tax=Kwoniella shivajii TaxID=564305 RepID=A0ABZ1CRX6_9TREE|nr:hypothetical protein IL334_000861 [Kwoniella shivajii]